MSWIILAFNGARNVCNVIPSKIRIIKLQLLRMWIFFAGIHWGKGGTMKHAYTGIKAARVVESLNKTYGLDVSSIHGFGFRWWHPFIYLSNTAPLKILAKILYLWPPPEKKYVFDCIKCTLCSYGGHVISAMATEIVFSKLGQIDRLTLLDPGVKVPKFNSIPEEYRVKGSKQQYGLLNRVVQWSQINLHILHLLDFYRRKAKPPGLYFRPLVQNL